MSGIRDLDAELLKRVPLPENGEETDKDSRGRVLVVGGSALSPGAVLLSSVAALRGGAGKVLVAASETHANSLAFAAPELGIAALAETQNGEPDAGDPRLEAHLTQCDAVLVGPGMTDEENARAFALRVLQKTQVPLVLDAAAITTFAGNFGLLHRYKGSRVLTPHAGEMAKLLGIPKQDVQRSAAEIARRAAKELNSVIILKGATTHIADPEGDIWRHCGGVCGLATAGSGDTLAGLIAALLARGASPVCACLWSVLVHARAGAVLTDDVGPVGFIARELPAIFPAVLRELAP